MRLAILATLALLAACGGGAPPPPVEARQFDDPGFVADAGYELRYGTVLAAELPAEVASGYGIDPRSDALVVNLSVLQRRDGRVPTPIEARVAGTWRGLVAEPVPIEFRAVVAGDAVSYIGIVPVADGQTVVLELEAWPAGATRRIGARITRRLDVE